MTTRQAFMIGCRLLAIYIVVGSLTQIPAIIARGYFLGSDETSYISIILSVVMVSFFAWLLWSKSSWIISKIFGHDDLLPKNTNEIESGLEQVEEETTAGDKVTIVNIEPILYSLMGAGVLAITLPDVASLLYTLIFERARSREDSLFDMFDRSMLVDKVALVTQCIIGFWLLFGSPGIVGKLRRLRAPEMQEHPAP